MQPELYSITNLKSGVLSIMAHPRGWDWLEDEILALKESRIDMIVSLLTRQEIGELGLLEEQALCQKNQIEYQSLPIPDRNVPPLNQATIEFIRNLYLALNQRKHIVIHCRAGIGRSAMIAASVLTLAGVSVEDAFEALAIARGRVVPDTDEQREWVVKFENLINISGPSNP